jgi:hypothetical protein
MNPTIIVVVALVLTSASQAETTPPQRSPDRRAISFGLLWENDSPAFKPEHATDRFYSNGTALFVAGAIPRFDLIPFWDAAAESYALGINLGHQIYTPSDLANANPIPTDHPYGGYFYGGLYWQRQNNDVAGAIDALDHLQLDLGIVGPSARAEQIQSWVHENFFGDEARGWDHQIHDEVTAQLYYRRKWRLTTESLQDTVDLIPSVGLALGSVHRRLEAGATLRVGYRLPDDFGPARIADLASATGQATSGWSVYGFARGGVRLVEHDIFLNGNNWRDSAGVAIEHVVAEGQLGVQIAWHCPDCDASIQVGYSQTFLTEQFREQESTHGFGAWTFSVTLGF